MKIFNPITLFVCKLAILVLIFLMMFALGKKHGVKMQNGQNRNELLPIYLQCHENFLKIPDEVKEKYQVRDHFLTLLPIVNSSEGAR